MFASLDPRSVRPQHLIERADECASPRRSFDRAVNANCNTAALTHYAAQLTQGFRLIRKELRRVSEGMFASLDPRSVRPQYLIERADECASPRRSFDRAVNANCNTAALTHYAAQLTQGSRLIRKELEAELAENYVKAS
jgi:hypothetical protein